MLLFAYLAYRFLLLILPFLIKFFILKENHDPESVIFGIDFNRKRSKRLARPLSWYLIFLLLYEVIPLWQFPARLSFYLLTSVRLALPIFAVVMGYGLIQILAIYLQENAKKRIDTWYEQLIPFIRATLQVVVIVFGFFYLLDALNVNVTGLIAGLSIGGLAVALAAQDSIKNLFGSLTIFIDRPFKVGDWITAEHIDGDVEEIGIRSTRIRTFANSILYIPNGKLSDMIIDNLGMRQYRRYRTLLNVRYDTPPAQLKAFIYGLREMVKHHPKTRKDFYGIHFFEYGKSSLDILFYIFFTVPTFEEEWLVKEEINFLILELADQLDVKFAFGTQTLHIESMPDNPPKNTNIILDENLKGKIEEFLIKNNLK
jgi:MscS family membrane protein